MRAERQTPLELLRRLRNLQRLLHAAKPVVMPPLEPFGIARWRSSTSRLTKSTLALKQLQLVG